MNTDSHGGVASLVLPADTVLSVDRPPRSSWMVCEMCDLVGGPFEPAEAAHLRAVHDRLHHGVTVAA
jgi:hypothetical protein